MVKLADDLVPCLPVIRWNFESLIQKFKLRSKTVKLAELFRIFAACPPNRKIRRQLSNLGNTKIKG